MSKAQIGKALFKGATALFQHSQQRKAEKVQEKQARAGRSNVMVNKQSNNDPIYPMYGRQRMGGTRAYIEASDGAGNIQVLVDGEPTNTEYLNIILAMTEGEMSAIEKLYFNDTVVWEFTAANDLVVIPGSGGYELANFETGTQYTGASMYIAWYPGSDTQQADPTITTSVGSSNWGSNHRLRGVSYLAMKLQANEKFGGQLPTFTAEMRGKKILDVSTLSQNDTLADMTSANYTSTSNQNPADVLYDYLISQRYGKGLDRREDESWSAGYNIDLASFKQARIDCDAARSGSGYPLNGFLQTEKQIFDNIGEILETCNGIILFVNGRYQFRIGKKDEQLNLPSSKVFDKTTILGEIALGLPTKSSKLNKVTGLYNNDSKKYNDDLVLFKSDAFILEDNGSVLEAQEDYTMITGTSLVTDLVTQMANVSRQLYQISFTAPHTALLLKSGDVIEVRHDDFGWGIGLNQTQKFWRCQELTLTEDNTVEIVATTYNSALEL